MIKTIGYDQSEIIKNIIDLHIKEGIIDCDPTYSTGNFYKKNDINPPKLKYDISPQIDGVLESKSENLPLEDESLNSIMFDPPFVVSKGPSLKKKKKGSNIISSRFSSYESIPLLWEYYTNSMKEFYRILKPGGKLIFKCQDTVSGGKNYFSHVHVMNEALKIGFYPKDLFILLAKNRLISSNMHNQQHARKYHSYFWVFEKKKVNIPYNINED
jgi:tRNA G10  N-methylase Trm11